MKSVLYKILNSLKIYRSQWINLKAQISLEMEGFDLIFNFSRYKFFLVFIMLLSGIFPRRVAVLMYILAYFLFALIMLIESIYAFLIINRLARKKYMGQGVKLYPKFMFFLLWLRNLLPFFVSVFMVFFGFCFLVDLCVTSRVIVYDSRGGAHRGSFLRSFHGYLGGTKSFEELLVELKNPRIGAEKSAMFSNNLYKELSSYKNIKK